MSQPSGRTGLQTAPGDTHEVPLLHHGSDPERRHVFVHVKSKLETESQALGRMEDPLAPGSA